MKPKGGATAENRKVLETFMRHHHRQGLSKRLVSVDELSAPTPYHLSRI